MVTVGMLYPGHSAEDDYPWLEERLTDGTRLPVVITSVGEDAHQVDALLDLGGADRLAEGARVLVEQHQPDAVMWACTSGSFVFGWDGAREQVRRLAEVTGTPASSTSLAFVHACGSIGVSRVAVAASYPDDVARRFVGFLGDGGITVTSMGSHEIYTAAEVGRLSEQEVVALAAGADTDGAEALLVPDTAMHTLAVLDRLEDAVGLPVLTANQVTVWQGLRLAGADLSDEYLGRLFRAPVAR